VGAASCGDGLSIGGSYGPGAEGSRCPEIPRMQHSNSFGGFKSCGSAAPNLGRTSPPFSAAGFTSGGGIIARATEARGITDPF
jgi:hypothetical protein